MEKIDKDYVLKVADLAKLSISEKDMEKYRLQLSDIMGEIDKITELEVGEDEKALLSPSNNLNDYATEEVSVISKELVLREASNKNSDYIIVPKVIK